MALRDNYDWGTYDMGGDNEAGLIFRHLMEYLYPQIQSRAGFQAGNEQAFQNTINSLIAGYQNYDGANQATRQKSANEANFADAARSGDQQLRAAGIGEGVRAGSIAGGAQTLARQNAAADMYYNDPARQQENQMKILQTLLGTGSMTNPYASEILPYSNVIEGRNAANQALAGPSGIGGVLGGILGAAIPSLGGSLGDALGGLF